MKRLALIALATLAPACGGGSFSAEDITDQMPSGLHAGSSWTMTKASVSSDGSDLTIRMFADEVEDCAFSSDSPFILFSVDQAEGEYPLKFAFDGTGQTITFVEPPSTNTIATKGIVTVGALSDSSVTIGLAAEAGDGFEINGRFTATMCP